MLFWTTVFVWIRKWSCNLGNGLRTAFIAKGMEYLIFQMVKRVFEESGNTFGTALSVLEQPSGFSKHRQGFIFQKYNALLPDSNVMIIVAHDTSWGWVSTVSSSPIEMAKSTKMRPEFSFKMHYECLSAQKSVLHRTGNS